MTTSIGLKYLSKISIAIIAFTAIGIATSASAKAATVVLVEDNFNTENSGNRALNYNNFANWNVTNGTVDLIGNGFFNFFPSNGLYVDTDGSSSLAGKLESKETFAFNVGDILNLTFKLAGDQRNNGFNSVAVSLGSLFNETITLPSTDNFTTFTRNITVTSATTGKLAFDGVGGDNVGLLLDDVKFTKTTSVPEPTSIIGILAFGAFSATSLCKRKQLQKAAVKA
ncbi:PEP-CTERM sorting domain-containing protein [Nostoc sp. FACHB-888]|uniref:PEP-CTERM sorting domain-containing protein n=1 Tax=Nostoc sp. FACHB-888 TaxID=2692842 RepID=UPI001687CF80|nr:PEP-CTERM sorting domain-containing protein [Nostoc sp. FACHB-888]MBD2242745.1 PEP-CTERM sorting domain-containing protein [Nostoc sp. FACHB-888]